MTVIFTQIQNELRKNASSKALNASLYFVPNVKKAYGIKMPVLNELAKKYKEGGFELVNCLWQSGAFEEKILASKILKLLCEKDPLKALQFVSDFSNEIEDWAVCDTLGMQSLKPAKEKIQFQIFDLSEKLSHSGNLWQRRLSLVLLEMFTKNKLLQAEIERRVANLKDDKEYYVKKAVVWLQSSLLKG